MNSAFGEVFLFLTDLAWKSRLTIPVLVTTVFLIMDIRLQIEVNIHSGHTGAELDDLDDTTDGDDDDDDDDFDDDDDDDDEDEYTTDDDESQENTFINFQVETNVNRSGAN